LKSGHLFINSDDNPEEILDAIIALKYDKEFCVSLNFDPAFIARLMKAGFLIMSEKINDSEYVVEPKHHLIRSVLFFENLHIGKTIRRFLPNYELGIDRDFEKILDNCVRIYGDGWLTPPLLDVIRTIRFDSSSPVKPTAFGVYRGGELKAGEFGIISGRVYTSYSGYHEESSAGTVQMIKTAWYLRDHGFAFWDFGMPLEYKNGLGAMDITTEEFINIFRKANTQ
jgi:Leu/Phe-tRNA-protein transferase